MTKVLANLGSNWMSLMEDSCHLSQLTIPGTHNTCATKTLAKCQSMSLERQLEAGVRFLDIRCRHAHDRFQIYHSSFSMELDFDTDVIDVCVKFLHSHPTECLLMLVSPEHTAKDNTMTFDQVFYKYVQESSSSSKFWFLDEHMPRLSECRGRIVLLRRFKSSMRPLGIDMSGWRCSEPCRMRNHSEFQFYIQDVFKLNASQKWQYVRETLDSVEAYNNSVTKLSSSRESSSSIVPTCYLNYCSAQNWPWQPPYVIALSINKLLTAYLDQFEENKKPPSSSLGILVLDFVNSSLIEKLYLINFRGVSIS